MDDQCFNYGIPGKGFVIIKPSERDISRYAVWFNKTLIGDNFDCPDDAADCAFRKDFSTNAATEFFKINVPWVPRNIRDWNVGLPCLPEEKEEFLEIKKECPPRPWRRSGSRR